MLTSIRTFFYGRALYWQLARAFARATFRARASWLRALVATQRARFETSLFAQFVWSSSRAALTASLAALAVVFGAPAAERVVAGAPWFRAAWDFFLHGVHVSVGADGYSTVVETVASITGLFLALHFGAVTAVAGASYAAVPSGIRQRYIQERVGNAYVRFLIFATTFALGLLSLHALGAPPSTWALAAVVLVAVPSMIAFVHLVRYHFRLLDPTVLADEIIDDFMMSARRCVPGWYGWSDRSFQNHHRNRARVAIDDIGALLQASMRRDGIDSAAIITFATRLLALLATYRALKSQIPSESLWYPRRAAARSYYLSSTSHLEVSRTLGTPLSAREELDVDWYEERILALLELVLAKLSDAPVSQARVLDTVNDVFAQGSELEPAAFIAATSRWTEARLRSLADDSIEALAVVDELSRLPVSLWIAFRRTLESPPDHIGALVRACRESGRAVLLAKASPGLKAAAENIETKLEFELAAGAAGVTPDWTVRHLLGIAYARDVCASARALIAASGFYTTSAERLAANGQWAAASMMISRGLEFLTRLERDRAGVTALILRLRPDRNAGDYVDLSFMDLQDDWAALPRARALLEDLDARSFFGLPKQSSRPAPGARSVPADLRGGALHRTAEALMRHLESGRVDRCAALVDAFFAASLQLSDDLLPEVAGAPDAHRGILRFGPVLDLLEITGLALAWSEYHQRVALWQPFSSCWLKYLGKTENMRIIAALLDGASSALIVGPRDAIRFAWRRDLLLAISALPRGLRQRDRPWAEPIVMHSSALVRALDDGNRPPLWNGLHVAAMVLPLSSSGRGRDLCRAVREEVRLGVPTRALASEQKEGTSGDEHD